MHYPLPVQQMADQRINSLVLAAAPLSSSPTSATKSANSGHPYIAPTVLRSLFHCPRSDIEVLPFLAGGCCQATPAANLRRRA
jgi:hypothetical protein